MLPSDTMSLEDTAQKLWDDLTEDQKTWVQALYAKHKKGSRPREEELKAELDGKIDRGFDPYEIPRAIASTRRITPLGVYAIDPESDVISELREAICLIRSWLVEDPDLREVTASEIAGELEVSETRASLLLYFMEDLDDFVGSATTPSDMPGYSKVSVHFDSFYAYDDNLKEIMEEAYSPPEEVEVDPGSSSAPEESPFVIRPVFQSRIARVDESLCFVLMPFSTDWSRRVYENLFRPAIEEAGYQCKRADESGGQIVAESIWTDINQAGLIVADLTNKNENVMYEIGIAHTVGKPVVLLSQDEIDPPFDIGHHRVHVYEDTSAGPEDLKGKLPGIIDDVTEEHERRKQQEMHLPPPPSNYYAGGPYRRGGLL